MRASIKILTIAFFGVFAVQLLVGCAPNPRDVSKQDVAMPKSNVTDEGASSGGGGYVSENSQILIDKVRIELSEQIRGAAPQIFKNMPTQLTQNQLADVIENIRLYPLKNKDRDGKQLMFNYGKDETGPYIEALQPFFAVYGSLPIKFLRYSEVKTIVKDLQLKLIHESGHLLGLNEERAEKFGMALLYSLKHNTVHCISEPLVDFPVNHELNDSEIQQGLKNGPAKLLEFVIFRGYGRVIQLVDSSMAMNGSKSYDSRQWFASTAELWLAGNKENDNPQTQELWVLLEDFTKWKLLKNGPAGTVYENKNPPLWEGNDTLTLTAQPDETYLGEYKYAASKMRTHSDKTIIYQSLPVEGRVQLKCTEKYEVLNFDTNI